MKKIFLAVLLLAVIYLICFSPYRIKISHNPFLLSPKQEKQSPPSPSQKKIRFHLGKEEKAGYFNIAWKGFLLHRNQLSQLQKVEEVVLEDVLSRCTEEEVFVFLSQIYQSLLPEGRLVISIQEGIDLLEKQLPMESSLEKKWKLFQAFSSSMKSFWSEKKLLSILQELGFSDVFLSTKKGPYFTLQAKKQKQLLQEQLFAHSLQLLKQLSSDTKEYEIRQKTLEKLFLEKEEGEPLQGESLFAQAKPLYYTSRVPLEEAHHFSEKATDRWVAQKAVEIPSQSKVLEIGWDKTKYGFHFAGCEYISLSLEKTSLEEWNFPEQSLDAIFCLEVLPRLADPSFFLQKIGAYLKPGGKLYLSSPLLSTRELSTSYYGRYGSLWYQHVLPKIGYELLLITPQGGFFKHLAQECAQVAQRFEEHRAYHGENASFIKELFEEILPRYLYALDDPVFIEATEGYHIEAIKS